MSVPATKKLWQGIAISFAIVFAYATVLVKLVHDWWTDENYSHGLLIPFIIGYILWAQRERLARIPVKSSTFLGGAAVICGLFGLWAGVAGAELYTQRLSLLLLLAGTVVYFWGVRLLRFLLVPFGLLVSGAADSGNHLQQDRVSPAIICFAMRRVVHEPARYPCFAPGKHHRAQTSEFV